MSAKRKPKIDIVIEGVRVRVYASRAGREAILGDGDIDDPDADVWIYPRELGFNDCARLARHEAAR